MTWHPDRVVVIAKQVDGGFQLIGSGAVVSDQRVLTALHVVTGHASVDEETRTTTPPLFARRDGSREFLPLGKVLWRGDQHLDAAVFEWGPGQVEQAHPCSILSTADLAQGAPWSARGYPMLNPHKPHATLAAFGGQCLRFHADHDKQIKLPVSVVPLEHAGYGGLSGAAVLDEHDRVVGVVRAVADPSVWDRQQLTAVPIACLVKRDDFLAALGVTPATERMRARLEAVVTEMMDLLRGHPRVVDAIASDLKLGPTHDLRALLDALVTKVSAADLAYAFNARHAESTEAAERRALEQVFWKTLRFAGDWRATLQQHVELFADQDPKTPVRISLRCWSKSIAAVILAGVDNFDVRFYGEEVAALQGTRALDCPNFLNMPATNSAPMFSRQGTLTASALVRHLARELAADEFRPFIDSTDPSCVERLRAHVEDQLWVRTYRPARKQEHAPRYLVVSADDLDANAFEALAQAVYRELPSLRVVLLEGAGLLKSRDEMSLHHGIMSMHYAAEKTT